MSLDSSLATLEKDVSPVAAVQPNTGAAFHSNGTDTADVADVSNQRPGNNHATAATSRNGDDVSRKPASILACTPATAATAENDDTAGKATSEPLPEPAIEARRQRVLTMLAERPGVRYAVLSDTKADQNTVMLALAILGVGTCELRIPRAKFDPFVLLDLIDWHGVRH